MRTQNVTAALAISNIVKSSLGPVGLDKMLVDGVGDVTITNDGATILKLLDVEHPAGKVLCELADLQDQEVGDGTTSVVIVAAGKWMFDQQTRLTRFRENGAGLIWSFLCRAVETRERTCEAEDPSNVGNYWVSQGAEGICEVYQEELDDPDRVVVEGEPAHVREDVYVFEDYWARERPLC